MLRFNLNHSDHPLLDYAHYGKTSGLLLAHKHDLPISIEGWICSTPSDSIKQIQNLLIGHKFMCRPDAPMGKGNKLPRGRDLVAEDIPSFCEEVQKICHNAIILVFPPPSVAITGNYIPRFSISGGIMAIIEKYGNIYIEFVGRGFDVGDITRGQHVHTSIWFPTKEVVSISLTQLFRLNKLNLIGKRRDISSKKYLLSRQIRINELSVHLNEDNYANIMANIPEREQILSLSLFKKLFSQCIEPILFSNDQKLGDVCGIMINIYGSNLYVFEIWRPIRNTPPNLVK